MNPTEADQLAKRIINTWRGGPPLTEWTDVLNGLDAGKAGTAYIRLRADSEQPPSIAKFLGTYRNLDTGTTTWKRPEDTGTPISFADYITRLTTRADQGDHNATLELANWERWLNRNNRI